MGEFQRIFGDGRLRVIRVGFVSRDCGVHLARNISRSSGVNLESRILSEIK